MADEEQEVRDDYDMSNVDYDMEYLIRRGKADSSRRSIRISRDRMDEEAFEGDFSPARKRPLMKRVADNLTPPEPVKASLMPPLTRNGWLHFFLVRLPIIEWVWTYRPSFFIGDIIAGITVAIMHIPQGLAYALLATLPAVYGLYASVMPVIVYSILGTSKHISVGTFAVVELMIGNAIQRTLPSLNLSICLSNSSEELAIDFSGRDTTCGAIKIEIAITLALITGIIMLGFGIIRLGFITIFLSDALVSGYTTGAAIHVFSSQLKHITGIHIPRTPGLFSVPNTWISFFTMLPEIKPAPVIMSIICIVILVVFKISNKMLQKHAKLPFPKFKGRRKGCITEKIKWPIPIPSQLIVVVVATLVFSLVQFEGKANVDIVGNITAGVPPLTVPNPVEYGVYLIQDAFIIAIVTYSVTVSLVKVFAREHDYTFDNNQEFIAYGVMNIVGSFFSSFPAAGSLSRSSIQSNAGGKTQLVGFLSSAIILVVLAALGPLFYYLPICVLASIIWVALYGMFKQFADIWKLFKVSLWDMSVWLVVFVATVLLGVDLGLGVGVGYSLGCLVLRTILPYSSMLGKAQGTEIFRNMENFEKIVPVPGVLIFRFQGPICFVNCAVFRSRLELLCSLYGKMGGTPKDGCLQQLFHSVQMARKRAKDYPVPQMEQTAQQDGHVAENITDQNTPTDTPSNIGRSSSFQQAMTVDVVLMDSMVADVGNNGQVAKNKDDIPVPIHTVIVDCAPISFLDAMGVKTLQQAVLDFDKHDIQVLFAAMTKENRDILRWSGFHKKCGKHWLFPTLQDAVHHAQTGSRLRPKEKVVEPSVVPTTEAPDTPEQTPEHLQIEEQDDVNNGRMSPILATDTVSDEFSGLKLTSDENSKEKKA